MRVQDESSSSKVDRVLPPAGVRHIGVVEGYEQKIGTSKNGAWYALKLNVVPNDKTFFKVSAL